MQDKEIRFKIDTRSQANILPVEMFKRCTAQSNERQIDKLQYTGEQLPVLGQCQLKYKDKILNFFVVDTELVPILGLQASKEHNLIKLVMNVPRSEKIQYDDEWYQRNDPPIS